MNYEAILAAASDHIWAYNDLKRAFPHGLDLYRTTEWGSLKAETARRFDRTEAVLRGICEVTGIPMSAAINAARIENRYYDRGGTRCIDAERLIRSQI